MHIRSVLPHEVEEVRSLLRDSGWEHRAADLIRLQELLANSQVALVAVDDREGVIGFVRALTDGISNGYVSMLAVRETRRGQGIGTALMRECMGANPKMTWVLRAGRPGLTRFYEKLGFRVSSVAMERPRSAEADA